MSTRSDDLGRVAYRDSVRDGLTDIMLAAVLLVLAVVVGTPRLTWLYMLPLIFVPAVTKRLRARFTMPRLGYVEPRTDPPREIAIGIGLYTMIVLAAMAVVLAFSGGLGDSGEWRRLMPGVSGVLIAGGMHYAWRRSGLRRYQVYGIVAVILGAGLSLWRFDGSYTGVRVHLVLMAGMVLIVGGLVFARFIRRYPVVALEQEDA
jgi:hypothetical protein